jgi:hypothetical protein
MRNTLWEVAAAIDNPFAARFARAVPLADPDRNRPFDAQIYSELRLCSPTKRQKCQDHRGENPAQRLGSEQPNLQIPISLCPEPAGSFFGDFRTPSGVRNSSRKQSGRFSATDSDMRTFLERLQWHLRGAVDSANTRLCQSTRLTVVVPLG